MIGAWKNILLENAAEWRLPAGGEWNFLVHNNYHPHGSYLNILWFHNGGQFPRVVVKCSSDAAEVKREFENARLAHQCAPDVVPAPLHVGHQGELWGFWMEGVPGSVLRTAGGLAPRVSHSLADMVASLHSAVRREGRPDPDRYRRMVQEPLAAVARFGSSASVLAGCSRLAAEVSPQWVASLPSIPQHGDLYAGNILSHRDRWYIVDWENFGQIDLPFFDLLTLFYSLLRDSGKTPETWDPDLMDHLPSLIRAYAQRLGLSTGDISLLLPLTLANWFNLHLKQNRKAFTEDMYQAIQTYFETPQPWERAFLV
jgi:aminoglycoside phosphotransferase (APT) family kinase protein